MKPLEEIVKINNTREICQHRDWSNHKPMITNKEVWETSEPLDRLLADVMLEMEYGPLETCSVCRGRKSILGRLGNTQHLQCQDCGIRSLRPIEDGIVMTSKEELEDE